MPFNTPAWRELERLCRDLKSRVSENNVGARLREFGMRVSAFHRAGSIETEVQLI
jgi:hypothetical protein